MKLPSLKTTFVAASLTAFAGFTAHTLRETFIAFSRLQIDASEDIIDDPALVRELVGVPGAFPACETKSGIPVRYVYNKRRGASPAYAKGPQQKNKATGEVEAYIVYTSFSAILSPEEFLFVAEHECAHQRLGHTEGVSLSNLLTDIKSREYDADCEAARELKRKFSYNGEQLKRAMKTVISMPESNTHPGGRQRYEYALQCLLDARP